MIVGKADADVEAEAGADADSADADREDSTVEIGGRRSAVGQGKFAVGRSHIRPRSGAGNAYLSANLTHPLATAPPLVPLVAVAVLQVRLVRLMQPVVGVGPLLPWPLLWEAVPLPKPGALPARTLQLSM